MTLRAYKIDVSSAVYIGATKGNLPSRQKSGKADPNPPPASDFDPSMYSRRDSVRRGIF